MRNIQAFRIQAFPYFEHVIFLGMLFFTAMPAGAAAEEPDYFHLSPESLLNMEIVSVSKKPEKLSKTPAAVFVITQEDIQRAGVLSLPDALRMAPGVQVAQADSNTWAISIRGFNGTLANKLLVLLDGRSLYNPLFAGTYWDLQDIMLEDIDRIEIIRGPGGAMWGANAVNGVINILTKNALETQGTIVALASGNEERASVTARHGGTAGEHGHYRVYTKAFQRDSSAHPAGGQQHDDWESIRAGFRYDHLEEFTLQGDTYRTLSDQLNATPLLIAPFSQTDEETTKATGASLLGRWRGYCGESGTCSLQSYVDYTNKKQMLLHDQRYLFDIEGQYDMPVMDRHALSVGGGYRLVHDDLGNAPTVTFSPAERSDNLWSAFFQDKVTLVPDTWFLTLGSKFEHNNYTGFEYQPDVRLQWHPDAGRTAWAAISRAVRTPSRLEHDLTQLLLVSPPGGLGPGATQVILNANSGFESEELVAYELGYRQQVTDNFVFDGTVFFNDYDEISVAGFLPSPPGTLNINAANNMKGETYGFELSGTWNMAENFKLAGTYSYIDLFLHARDTNGFNLETAEGLVPRHQATLRGMWNVTDRLSLDTSLYYVDELKQSDVHAYVRTDINIGWRARDNMRLNLIGKNIFDESHREFSTATSLNAAEVERSIVGKLTWQF